MMHLRHPQMAAHSDRLRSSSTSSAHSVLPARRGVSCRIVRGISSTLSRKSHLVVQAVSTAAPPSHHHLPSGIAGLLALLQYRPQRRAVTMPFNVIVTGSTKGVGKALAREFLLKGDSVIISSRSEERVAEVVEELSNEFGSDRVKGFACNVAMAADVRALAEYGRREMGTVDIWINNAGTNAYKYSTLLDSTDDDLREIVSTNLLGTMLCCREAAKVMKSQEHGGHIFNIDGAGADGDPTPRFAAYGATKRALVQMGKSFKAELLQANINNVGIHNLSPGMVVTELLMSATRLMPTATPFINALAEKPEDVASFLVPRVRRVPIDSISPINGSIHPSYVQFLTKPKAFTQLLARFLLGARKDRFVKEQ